MRFSSLVCIAALCQVSTTAVVQKRDADFWQVNVDQTEDSSLREGVSADKYFHESKFSAHYDGRFASKPLPYKSQTTALSTLIQAYLSTFASLGIETWLMHGTLLGWYWNQRVLPWDSDLDVQISESNLFYLAAYYNMTTFRYHRRNYLLEINPHFRDERGDWKKKDGRNKMNKLNKIDARWIDVKTGLFIDITGVRYLVGHEKGEGVLGSKDGHTYRDTYLYPLRETTFEGVKAKIPYMYRDFLIGEYGADALNNTDFNYHIFDEEQGEWVPKYPDGKGGYAAVSE